MTAVKGRARGTGAVVGTLAKDELLLEATACNGWMVFNYLNGVRSTAVVVEETQIGDEEETQVTLAML